MALEMMVHYYNKFNLFKLLPDQIKKYQEIQLLNNFGEVITYMDL